MASAPAAESRCSLSLRAAQATPGDGRAIPTPAHDVVIGGLGTSTFLTRLVVPVRCDWIGRKNQTETTANKTNRNRTENAKSQPVTA